MQRSPPRRRVGEKKDTKVHATLKAIVHGMTGLVLSGSLLVLGIIATSSRAVASDGRAEIPGVFEAWMEQYEGSPSLSSSSSRSGLAVFVVVLTLGYVAVAYGIGGIMARRRLGR